MQTIQAQVNPRLLSKADRLFTGTLAGRIIEILQNARRAGATEVMITNQEGMVTVQDNGHGIQDFAQLLDLGSSGWDDSLEQAEDPAGVGIFCLAPRQVKICSGHQSVVITEQGWTGEPLLIGISEKSVIGTALQFTDEPWSMDAVEKHAVFSGLRVVVDDRECSREPFVSSDATYYPKLGCRIEVIERKDMGPWHSHWRRNYYTDDVLINFHGQIIQFHFRPIGEELLFLVDLTGESTQLRLMLPARTQMVQNEALEQLKAVLEIETYRYLKKRGTHRLKYSQYCRGRELGVDLPEAIPSFNVGLLYEEGIEPIEFTKPEDFPLGKCYRMGKDCKDEFNEATVHLLAALGKFHAPFVPVEISPDNDGYSWADLPTIEKVVIQTGSELLTQWIWSERLTAVESLQVTVHTSDGKVFSCAVPMVVRKPIPRKGDRGWDSVEVLVTPAARDDLHPSDIWYHLGGFHEDSDTYDTQLYRFENELDLFWADLVGPGVYLRSRLLECLRNFNLEWQAISIDVNKILTITYPDGRQDVYPQQS
ncbi:hypothetical protein ACFL6U_31450 [Planctomycetota bacterium]